MSLAKTAKKRAFLDETIAWYERNYKLDRVPVKRVGGKGDFSIPDRYVVDGRHYVGEAGGLQDFMWGFGMRYAITSGVLAAKSVMGGVGLREGGSWDGFYLWSRRVQQIDS